MFLYLFVARHPIPLLVGAPHTLAPNLLHRASSLEGPENVWLSPTC